MYYCGMEIKFDYISFVWRTKLKQREIAAGVGSSLGLIGQWATGKGVPSYEKLGGLIELGMTAQEMFGKEMGDLLVRNSQPKERPDKDELREMVKSVLTELAKPE